MKGYWIWIPFMGLRKKVSDWFRIINYNNLPRRSQYVEITCFKLIGN